MLCLSFGEDLEHQLSAAAVESTFSTVRLRTRITKGGGSRAADADEPFCRGGLIARHGAKEWLAE